MTYGLKHTYFSLLLPAVTGFVAVYILDHFDLVAWKIPQLTGAIPIIIFVASVCTAVALPILYRTTFANKQRHQIHTPEKQWLKFERNVLFVAMATPYIGLIAHILRLPRFHLTGTYLMALYAMYYFYPSIKRIEFERRVFRVK
jgi:hypothetical protein